MLYKLNFDGMLKGDYGLLYFPSESKDFGIAQALNYISAHLGRSCIAHINFFFFFSLLGYGLFICTKMTILLNSQVLCQLKKIYGCL